MSDQPIVQTDDICALPLVRRLAAMLDRDPSEFREGEPLPRGWHVILFNLPTKQSHLRHDGSGELGVPLPDIGLPRLMIAGRQQHFRDEIPIGARVIRRSQADEVVMKTGRSGRFALVSVEHQISVAGRSEPAIIERQQYVLRAAESPEPQGNVAQPQTPSDAGSAAALPDIEAESVRTLIPDERLLFRYSSLTDNPHRIHYDRDYARTHERYPDLVVNGTLPLMFLLEMLPPSSRATLQLLKSRNVSPMFCNQALQLCARPEEAGWRLWAQDTSGRLTFEAQVE